MTISKLDDSLRIVAMFTLVNPQQKIVRHNNGFARILIAKAGAFVFAVLALVGIQTNVTFAAGENGINVHLAPEVLGSFGGIMITPTLITSWITMAFLIILAIIINKRIRQIPSRLQSVFEMLIGGAFDYCADTLESKELARKYFPIIMTIFLFVLIMNWTGLLPGEDAIGIYKATEEGIRLIPFFYPPTTDLNVTLAIAIIAFVTVEVAGVSVIGVWKYAGKFINFSSPLAFVIGLIELLSELARLVAFSFRLFGNIFAGKVLILVVMFLTTPYLIPVPMMMYESFVGLIQAFIFAILTLFFIKLAVMEPEHI